MDSSFSSALLTSILNPSTLLYAILPYLGHTLVSFSFQPLYEQYLDRGIKEITAYCEQNNLELEKIFTDQQTGKNFNRPRYQVLKEDVSRAGDKLIITEVDNFTSYKNYNIWLIELKRNISGKVICVTRGDTNWKDKSR